MRAITPHRPSSALSGPAPIAALLALMVTGVLGACADSGATIVAGDIDQIGIEDVACGNACGPAEVCVMNQCRTRCANDSHCPPGQVCDVFRSACFDYTPPDLADFDPIEPDAVDPADDTPTDTADGDTDDGITEIEPDVTDDVERGYREEGQTCSQTIECAVGLACYLHSNGIKTCVPLCQPFNPAPCSGGRFCHIPETPQESDIYGSGDGVCLDDNGGGLEGAPCYGQFLCRPDFVCFNRDHCVQPCPTNRADYCATDPNICSGDPAVVPPLGVGLCIKCSDGAACPDGFACNQTTGACVSTASDCRQPGQECQLPRICSQVAGVYQCTDGCQLTGCPSGGFCDRSSGYCRAVCVPSCPVGQCCNSENRCGSCCVPDCQVGFYCDDTTNPPVCREIADCRLSTAPNNGCATGEGCDPVRDLNCFREECDQNSGLCVKRCPTTCPAGTFCDDVRTQFKCRAPQSGECNPANPTGTCPGANEFCQNGLCIPRVSENCIRKNEAAGLGDTCCEEAPMICGGPTVVLMGAGVCCETDQSPGCVDLVTQTGPFGFFILMLSLLSGSPAASCM